MHLTDDQLQELRKKLSDGGREVNEKIIAIQAGKHVLADSVEAEFGEPGDDRVTRLRLFLTAIQSRMKLIREGGNYGVCKHCGSPIDFSDLSREPWLDRHRTCADPQD
jgi:RNA polymerase-binding transcription factor DksA